MVEAKANHREVVYTEFPEVDDGVYCTWYSCLELRTHTHNDLSLTLNGAVRLALNPESHAKRRSSSVVSLPLEDKKKSSVTIS